MKFEVKKDGKTKMHTDEESSIPDRETRECLRRAGYKLYLDGNIYREVKR